MPPIEQIIEYTIPQLVSDYIGVIVGWTLVFVVLTGLLWKTSAGQVMRWTLFLQLTLIPLALLELVFLAGFAGVAGICGAFFDSLGSGNHPTPKGIVLLGVAVLFAWYLLCLPAVRVVVHWLLLPILRISTSPKAAGILFTVLFALLRLLWVGGAVVLWCCDEIEGGELAVVLFAMLATKIVLATRLTDEIESLELCR